MAAPMLVDTDVLVDFLRGFNEAVTLVNTHAHRIILSAVAVAELYAGVKGDKEQNSLDNFISLFPVIPVTGEIAKSGGLYRSKYRKSHGTGLADAIMAATADSERAELVTLNTRHYPMFKGLKPPYVK